MSRNTGAERYRCDECGAQTSPAERCEHETLCTACWADEMREIERRVADAMSED